MKRASTSKAVVFIAVALWLSAPAVHPGTDSANNIDGQVARLIEATTDGSTEAQAFVDLEALGCQAVPFIIRRMDDRRPLPIQAISLMNKSPDAFEGRRHYGPEQVVDALAAILNQVTGQSFGFIYNGASDDERNTTVKQWGGFLERVGPKGVCGSHGT